MDKLKDIFLFDENNSEIKQYFSFFGKTRYKLLIMIEYLISLSKIEIIEIGKEDIDYLRNIYTNFNLENCSIIFNYTKTHSYINSLTKFLKDTIDEKSNMTENGISNFINFCLPESDINSIYFTISIKEFNTKHLLTKINSILKVLKEYILKWTKVPIITKLDNKFSAPTFLGKELLIFYERLIIQSRKLNNYKYTTKFGGINGNFNEHHTALPNIDWIEFGDKFIKIFNLERNQYTKGIDHYDNYIEIFDNIKRINKIFIDFINHILEYEEIGYLNLNNDIKQSLGYFVITNNHLDLYQNCLINNSSSIYSLSYFYLEQLSLVFYNLIQALNLLDKSINNLDINLKNIDKDLNSNYDIIVDGIISRLKILGIFINKDELKANINKSDNSKKYMKEYIENLDIDNKEKTYLNTITQFNYTGIYKL